jgi:small subunit ribosomal protein S3Ae
MPPKGQAKKGKGSRKKFVDPFLKKEWYVVKLPLFVGSPLKDFVTLKPRHHRLCYTPAKKAGAKKQLDSRVFTVSLADLEAEPAKNDYDSLEFIKFQFIQEEVQGMQLLTQWHGMDITRDKRSSLIRKWRTMIQCLVDVTTSDGYKLRVKAIAFTKRQPTQVKKNCYAKTTQVAKIRARMTEIIKSEVSSGDLKALVAKLHSGEIGKAIHKSCQLIFPLEEKACLVEKVKVMRKPKKDVATLMKMHDLEHTFDALEPQDLEMADEEKGKEAEPDDDEEAEAAE